jgi:hypothetical protein
VDKAHELSIGSRIGEPRHGLAAKIGNGLGKLSGSCRRFAQPEGDRRRGAMRVLNADFSRLHPPDLPGFVPEKENVAGHALHGKVLIHLANGRPIGLLDHVVIRCVWDRSPAGDGRQPRAPPASDAAMHAVVVEVSGASPAPR